MSIQAPSVPPQILCLFHQSQCAVPTAAPLLWTNCQICHTNAFKTTLNVTCLLLPSLLGAYGILGNMQYSLHLFYLLSYFCLCKIKFEAIPEGFCVQGMPLFTSFCPYCHIWLCVSYLRTVILGRHLRAADLGL